MSDEIENEEIDINVDKQKINNIVSVKRIYGDDRITSNSITLFELVNVVNSRSDQINNGAELFIPFEINTSRNLAIKEILEGKCPIKIIRSRGVINNIEYIEEWSVNELEIPKKCISSLEISLNGKRDINIREKINNTLKF